MGIAEKDWELMFRLTNKVLGASDRYGAHPATDPLRPHDLTATIFYLLGIDPQGVFYDKNNRPHFLTRGEPLHVAGAFRQRYDGDGMVERFRAELVRPYAARLRGFDPLRVRL